jgi:hypothetical protein
MFAVALVGLAHVPHDSIMLILSRVQGGARCNKFTGTCTSNILDINVSILQAGTWVHEASSTIKSLLNAHQNAQPA